MYLLGLSTTYNIIDIKYYANSYEIHITHRFVLVII